MPFFARTKRNGCLNTEAAEQPRIVRVSGARQGVLTSVRAVNVNRVPGLLPRPLEKVLCLPFALKVFNDSVHRIVVDDLMAGRDSLQQKGGCYQSHQFRVCRKLPEPRSGIRTHRLDSCTESGRAAQKVMRIPSGQDIEVSNELTLKVLRQ